MNIHLLVKAIIYLMYIFDQGTLNFRLEPDKQRTNNQIRQLKEDNLTPPLKGEF